MVLEGAREGVGKSLVAGIYPSRREGGRGGHSYSVRKRLRKGLELRLSYRWRQEDNSRQESRVKESQEPPES